MRSTANVNIKGEAVSCVALREAGQKMHYVYIIKSKRDGSFYTGFTEKSVTERVQEHNEQKSVYTAKKIPWEVVWFCGFQNKLKALDFEKYLKSGSGFAFARKRLIS